MFELNWFFSSSNARVTSKHSFNNWENSPSFCLGNVLSPLATTATETSHKNFPKENSINEKFLDKFVGNFDDNIDLMAFFNENLINFIDVSFFFYSHNTRTTQWEDPRIQAAAAALSHGNLFSSSEHSSVETLFSSPTQLSSLGSSNGNNFIHINFRCRCNLETKAKRKDLSAEIGK